jgi:hypothetical protein
MSYLIWCCLAKSVIVFKLGALTLLIFFVQELLANLLFLFDDALCNAPNFIRHNIIIIIQNLLSKLS